MGAARLIGGMVAIWAAGLAHAACPPGEFDRAALDALKASGFAVAEPAARAELAVGMLDCLDDPDPTLRDGIAYEAYSSWLRANALPPESLRVLRTALLKAMRHDSPDPSGFHRPFAALVLAEVARTDRIEAWMTDAERDELVRAASDYVSGVRDYRGFDEKQGWRHGVAHGADLLMQLALNNVLARPQLDLILDAAASQVAPPGAVFYHYGESERLVRPVLFVAARGLHAELEWTQWLAGIASPAPMSSWNESFKTQAGLAKKHNTAAFLQALYLNVAESEDADLRERLMPGLKAAVRALP